MFSLDSKIILLALVVMVEVVTVVVVVVDFGVVISLNILFEECLGSVLVLPNKLKNKGFSSLSWKRYKSNVDINMNLILL